MSKEENHKTGGGGKTLGNGDSAWWIKKFRSKKERRPVASPVMIKKDGCEEKKK